MRLVKTALRAYGSLRRAASLEHLGTFLSSGNLSFSLEACDQAELANGLRTSHLSASSFGLTTSPLLSLGTGIAR